MAQWVLDHVLHGPPVPVPSYGFDLTPVVAHSLRRASTARDGGGNRCGRTLPPALPPTMTSAHGQ
ncbi:hypothetical protein CP975_28895 [Streptomyces alboniger]|uniref:Uncharacterized protein n=1 Tax=Streptomyces alboniger TaxID=132473 RepID=A0A5J6HWK4_STRAD|nr:hypothetical protein CP975_28895 [Streptomyces alboniger]